MQIMSQYFAFVSEVKNIISLLALKFFPFLNVPLQRKQRNRGKTVLNWTVKCYKKEKSGTYICYQSIEKKKTRRHWFLSEILKATNWFENIVPLWLPHSFHLIHFQLVCCNFDAVFVPFFIMYTFVCVSSLFLRMWKQKSIMRSLCVCVYVDSGWKRTFSD